MPQDEITPVSESKVREMTRAYPEIPDNRKPLCYEQCVEGNVTQAINPQDANE